jgi:type I restriction enzyme M protein
MAYSSLFQLHSRDLTSEAEVETRLLAKLFADLGYPAAAVVPKASVPSLMVASGSKRTKVHPDFLLKGATGVVRVVVEAKDPNLSLSDAWGQAAGYALTHNSDKRDEERVRWLLLSNGHLTSLYRHDSSQPTLTLRLADFVSGSPLYASLRTHLKYTASEPVRDLAGQFDVITPDQLNTLFNQSHQLIWKKQKMSPADAFFEFCKFIFVKLVHDKRRERVLAEGRTELFPMTTAWLDAVASTSKHPVRDILFRQLRDELESAISQGKKRIFDPGETLRLSADTCRELIRRFEHVNLSSIDEDLNGRMFEVFLNEAVRGRDLGQYFTPRPLVEFMTRIALAGWADPDHSPRIIDACCGTGGFLIETMAFQLAALRNDSRLNETQRAARGEVIKNTSLFGVEANQRVSRIARINMHLHGDGGSHIFWGDGLDSEPQVTTDMTPEEVAEARDHAATITEGTFDLALSNPPFSMEYSTSAPDEERILRQLSAANRGEAPDVLDKAQKVKSNLLFMFRYYRLLKPGGEMLIVLDDTILNGDTLLEMRQWILRHFVLLAVHSLPVNAFFKAKANIKTSVLHVRKKATPDEAQGHVFMAATNNIGHDSRMRDTPERNNLNDVFTIYDEWQRTGRFMPLFKANNDPNEKLERPAQVWLVPPDELVAERLDAFFYAPELKEVYAKIDSLAATGTVEVFRGGDFHLRRKLTKAERKALSDSRTPLRYIEISDVTAYGLIVSFLEGTIDEFPTRAQYRVETGDVLVAINARSRGTVVLVPPQFDGALCTSGFLVIKPRSTEEGRLLWYTLRSELCRHQIYYLAQTASQSELKLKAWREMFQVPLPVGAGRALAIAESGAFHDHLGALLDADRIRLG